MIAPGRWSRVAAPGLLSLDRLEQGLEVPLAEALRPVLAAIPEVLEVQTITGAGDTLCRVVARTNADLQRVLDAIVSVDGIVRSSTLISLATEVPDRLLLLVRAAASGPGPQRP